MNITLLSSSITLMGRLKKACPVLSLVEGVFPGFAGAARQTWGRPFAAFGLTDLPLFAAFALTYAAYAPHVKTAAAFPSTPLGTGLDEPFGKTLRACFFEHSLTL